MASVLRLPVWLLCLAGLVGAADVQFNRDIRPILSDRCFACHGPDNATRKANFRLDIESDSRDKTLILKRVTSPNKALRMPPAYLGHEPLTERQIGLLRAWIEQGAKYEPHWSFIAPQKSAAPAGNEIDYFISNRLKQQGLSRSPQAGAATLRRRVTLDLTGLPPSPEDPADEPYEKLVDRLLASPRYAERMAIRWLEAARYSDTNGYQTDGPRTMWPWRDWVIDAFRRDMPYDQFIIEQLAGDLLPNATLPQKIATAFNRNHRTSAEGGIVDEEFRVEYVSDRTDTTATVFLGLTAGCARCHDHKFDPLTQQEYYKLYAFFNNTPDRGFVWNFGNEEPVVKTPSMEQQAKLDAMDREIANATQEIVRLEPEIQHAQAKWERKLARSASAVDWTVTNGQKLHLPLNKRQFDGKDFLDAGKDGPKFDYRDPFTIAAWVKPESATGAIVSRGEDYAEGQQHGLYIMDGKLRLHVTFRWTDLAMRVETVKPLVLNAWQHVSVSYDGGMRASGVRMYVNGEPQELKVLFDYLLWPIDTSKQPWRVGAGGGIRLQGSVDEVRVYNRVLDAGEIAALTVREPLNAIARLKPAMRGEAQKTKLRLGFLEGSPLNAARSKLNSLKAERQAFLASVPSVMVMQEQAEPRQTFLLKRGAYDAPGMPVKAGVPSFLPPLDPAWPTNRLGLARWIADRRNPLTARAAVNRLWAMLFGIGLVKTVEDFGSQGEWPGNQELLDWLAVEFMDSGWSVKHILKTIVMSETYRQSSKVTPELLQRDPENRLLARGPRFRLSAEMIRDQALAASGLLVEKVGGPPVKPYQPAGLWQELQGGGGYKEEEGDNLYRRSLYSYWRRTVAPPNMVTFDAPTRETCVIRENRTNTPLQALDLMNDVVYVEASRKLAERMIQENGIDTGYQRVLARKPSAKERASLDGALEKFRTYYASNLKEAEAWISHGKSPRNAKISAPELAAWTAVASIILNQDEAINKE
jgi:hypothetical protein